MSARPLLTRAEAAALVGVSQNAVAVAAREHRLGYVKIGNRYLFREDDVDAWVESMRVPPTAQVPGRVTAMATPRALALQRRRRSR